MTPTGSKSHHLSVKKLLDTHLMIANSLWLTTFPEGYKEKGNR
jgi:hypothetical protein